MPTTMNDVLAAGNAARDAIADVNAGMDTPNATSNRTRTAVADAAKPDATPTRNRRNRRNATATPTQPDAGIRSAVKPVGKPVAGLDALMGIVGDARWGKIRPRVQPADAPTSGHYAYGSTGFGIFVTRNRGAVTFRFAFNRRPITGYAQSATPVNRMFKRYIADAVKSGATVTRTPDGVTVSAK